MSIRARFIIAIIFCLFSVMAVEGLFLNRIQARMFEKEAIARNGLVSLFSQACRDYVKEVLRPELQKHSDDFIIEGMSSTFATNGIFSKFNENMPDYVYRQPTLNPLNPDNQADEFEQSILETFRQDRQLENLSGYRHIDGREQFYMARPVIVETSCLTCHGVPEDAPTEITTRYGRENGFGWVVGEVIGATMISVPTQDLRQDQETLMQLVLGTFVFLAFVLLALTFYLFNRLVNQPIQKTLEVMDDVAMKPDSSRRLSESAPGEFGSMARAFNRMAETITRNTSNLEKQVRMKTADLTTEIAERKRKEQELRTLTIAMEQSPVSVMITNTDGIIEYVNPRFTELTGYSPEEIIGKTPRILKSDEMPPEENEEMWAILNAGNIWRGEFRNIKKNGESQWESASISPIRNDRGAITHFITVKEEITEKKQQEQILQEAKESAEFEALTDRLTGLPNRILFQDRLEQIMKRARRDDEKFAVLFFDFDRFKVVNDSLGHSAGDALLCDIARLFRDELRKSDTVARFGGDEFVVLLGKLGDWSDAQVKARHLLDIFAKPHLLGEHHVVSTASIGLVTNEHPYRSADEMIRDADVAMYQAKEGGKGQIVVFDQEMHDRALDRLALEEDLRSALEREQLYLVYQPIISLESGIIDGFEALLRWDHPERGAISPLDFVPIAEDTGLIIEIGAWVLETACRQIAKWNQTLGREHRLKVNVNVSKRQLLGSHLIDKILACLELKDLQSQDLQLEITETSMVDDQRHIIPLLHQLREHGIQIALDDFGTGHSSLSALHNFPINVLKIDQSFIRGCDGNRPLMAVVSSIANLAENLSITTVAEGIETREELVAAQSIGCTMGQGFFFAKPMLPDDAERYLLDIDKERRSA